MLSRHVQDRNIYDASISAGFSTLFSEDIPRGVSYLWMKRLFALGASAAPRNARTAANAGVSLPAAVANFRLRFRLALQLDIARSDIVMSIFQIIILVHRASATRGLPTAKWLSQAQLMLNRS